METDDELESLTLENDATNKPETDLQIPLTVKAGWNEFIVSLAKYADEELSGLFTLLNFGPQLMGLEAH